MFEEYGVKEYEIDAMFDKLKSKIIERTEKDTKASIDNLTKENKNLKDINMKLLKAAKRTEEDQNNFKLATLLIDTLKNKIQKVVGKEKADIVYKFLDSLFETDFNENTYEVPVVLACAVKYYNNREAVIELLKALDFKVPKDMDKFRMPHEWTEEELDVFFDNMDNHVNCNGCVFRDNLKFWSDKALKDPKVVCTETFSEVPWQFLLRNPLLKKEKYLTQIGKMFCTKEYRSSHWLEFAHITEYQELTDDELKLIINNINYEYYYNKDSGLKNFLLKNINLIEDEVFLAKVYNYNFNCYDFKYNNTILKMPYKFVKQYVKDIKDFNLEWLKRNRDRFTKEQITELTLIALGVGE